MELDGFKPSNCLIERSSLTALVHTQSHSFTLLILVLNSAEDSNVIVVDWSRLAALIYFTAVTHTLPVGTYLGQFLSILENNSVDLRNVHLIGHSLGAHISGIAGAHVGGRIGRITGNSPIMGDNPKTLLFQAWTLQDLFLSF